MSLLEGGRDHRQVYPVPSPYGTVIPQCAYLQLDGVMDIAVNETGDTAFAAGSDTLYAIDVSNPQRPIVTGKLEGIRSGRQIEVSHGLAAVTSRADGVFFCDVRNASALQIVSHYDTIELATGVCIKGNLCFITCRHYGVEIVDISDPAHPVHISNVLAGEAQSVFVDQNFMYVGAWMEREIRIFDISDPAAPRPVSRCKLDGFGDGVFVRNGLCYAATGHHARRLNNRRKFLHYDFVTEDVLSEGYGGGHGLEIFDVSDPCRPALLSRIKTPPLFMSGYDLWDVIVSGDHAFLADTFNGMFMINIADQRHPYFEGYRRLDLLQNSEYRHEPPVQQLCKPVTGLAVIDGHVLAAGVLSGLHVLQIPFAAEVPLRMPVWPSTVPIRKQNNATVFQTDSQIHGLVFVRDMPVVAAGDRGMVVLDPQNAYAPIRYTQGVGSALDIKTDGKFLYLAEGLGGFSVWRLDEKTPVLLCLLTSDVLHESVRQVVLLGQTRVAALQLGTKKIAFINIANPENPEIIEIVKINGTMYYKNIADGLLFGKYAAAVPLSPGIEWFEVGDSIHHITKDVQSDCQICPIEEGICFGACGSFTIYRGRYLYSERLETSLNEANTVQLSDQAGKTVYLSGRPVLLGHTLCLLNRQNGRITFLDVQDPKTPEFLSGYQLDGNPEQIIAHNGRYWVCCGHGGLQNEIRCINPAP